MPRLGKKYEFQMETFVKSREEYQTQEYLSSGAPVAPAVMVGEEIADQGPNISEEKLAETIRRHLGLPPVEVAG
jgi:hypothetical protein